MRGERYRERFMQGFFPYAVRGAYLNLGTLFITTLTAISLGYCAGEPSNESSQTKLALTAQSEANLGVSEWKADGAIAEHEYSHDLVLEKGKLTVYWKNDSEHLYMALKGKTTGWVSIGFEPTRRMRDADMVFGWVEDGEATVLDLYSTGTFGPHPPDEELGETDDLLEVAGKEEGGFTIIEFKRKMDTGDKYDKAFIPGGTIKFIWAMAGADSLRAKHNVAKGRGEIALEEATPESVPTWMDIELSDAATGEKFKISDFKGTPILVESFAVWCPTCLRQQKEMQELKAREGDTIIHISLDTDPNEDETKVKEHVEAHGLDWYFAVSPLELTKALMDEFGLKIVSAPSAPVLLICEDQSTRFLRSGVKSADELLSEIDKGC